MTSRFEFFVALRYLRAKRKQAVISVITAISIIGVAAGVMALVIALAINNGFRNTLQRNLLGAAAHVNILEKQAQYGIENWREKLERAAKLPHVVAVAPVLYAPVFLSGPAQSKGAILKGIDPAYERGVSDMLRSMKRGSLDRLKKEGKIPCILLGSRLSQDGGMLYESVITVISPQGELTAFGPRPKYLQFRVCGIFESGFYDFDANWAYVSLQSAQKVLAVDDVITAIELKLSDIYRAPEVAEQAGKMFAPDLAAQTWMEQNRQLESALRMEKAVTVVTIGLIQLVAALNILIALVMMVMERYRDIAVLMSMGARQKQIRNIFMLEGVIIGVTGTVIGMIAGHALSYLADRNRWISLDEQIYALSFVPFEPRWTDSLWIAGIAITVSFLATLYPARSAARIAPVEVLRYE